MANLSGIGYFLLLLGVLVAVHEFGHFIVAKACGVKVLKFSIGFGPRLLGFTKGETEYRISLLPLGGYVKMAGEQPHEELSPEEAKRGFLAQPPWKRMLIIAAGPAFNLIFPILVFFFFYLGPADAISPKVGYVEPGMPAAEAGIQAGDEVLSVDGDKVATFNDLVVMMKDRAGESIPVMVQRGDQVLTFKVKPIQSVEDIRIEKVPRAYIGIASGARPPVVGVPKGSVAESAGIKTSDRVLSVNGKPVSDVLTLSSAIDSAEGNELKLKVARYEVVDVPGAVVQAPKIFEVSIPKQAGKGLAAAGLELGELYVGDVTPGGAADKLGLKPGDRIVSVDGKPYQSSTFFGLQLEEADSRPLKVTWLSNGVEKSGDLVQGYVTQKDELGNKLKVLVPGLSLAGSAPAENVKADLVKINIGPVQALRLASREVPDAIRQVVVVLRKLVTGELPAQTVGGPIMMYRLAAQTSELGMGYFLRLLGIISVNLGIMNLLPIPVLDGFGLLSAVWEGVRRRPIPVRAREVANIIGLAMLVILMVMVFVNDTKKALSKDDPVEQTQ